MGITEWSSEAGGPLKGLPKAGRATEDCSMVGGFLDGALCLCIRCGLLRVGLVMQCICIIRMAHEPRL